MTDTVVQLSHVTKIFSGRTGTHTALNDVSFEVQSGEVIALIGPSGSGKSTCLRTINALESITSGHISVCGLDYNTHPTHDVRRKTAMVFQRFELFAHLSAQQNIGLALHLVRGQSKTQADEAAMVLLEQVGLRSHAHKYPRSLSGGQQQRVAIARALAVNPKVLLCDEPTSALDPELVGEISELLAQIASTGMTMIIVTHEMRFARDISSRTLFLESGVLVESGPSSQIFENPQTDRLQSFLKQLNLGR